MRAAVDVARFEASQVFAVKELVEKENIDCDFVLTRACDAILDPELAEETHRAFRELARAGEVDLKDVYHSYGKDAEQVSPRGAPPGLRKSRGGGLTMGVSGRSCRASRAPWPASPTRPGPSGPTSW